MNERLCEPGEPVLYGGRRFGLWRRLEDGYGLLATDGQKPYFVEARANVLFADLKKGEDAHAHVEPPR